MAKIEQFISSLNQMTKKNFVKWVTTADYTLDRGNEIFNAFIKDSIDNLELNPRISYTGEFYGNIVSLLHIRDKETRKKNYFIYIQTSPDTKVRPVNLDKLDRDAYDKLLKELLDLVRAYID